LKFLLNPARQTTRGLFTDVEYEDVERFFRSRPELTPTPLVHLPALASRLGLTDLMVKDESKRFGMGAFKIAGVLYAVDALLAGRIASIHEADRVRTLVCATEGNHGRAVARVARDRGLRATVYMRSTASAVRVEAIRREGADVILVDGTYDDAVHRVAVDTPRMAGAVIVSDTAWPGYEEIPRAIMAGYSWLMVESANQWARMPDVVAVQAGVGGLAGAVTSWLRARGERRPYLICAEPTAAACVFESIAAGRRRTIVPGPTEMAGLRSGEVSSIAFPVLEKGVDSCAALDDDEVGETIRDLAAPTDGDPVVRAAPSGGCGAAAIVRWMKDIQYADSRRQANLTADSIAFVINTEGPGDAPTPG
jgi:diaminopropionate ammonia-lyase